jgi:hypothetical protein
VAAAYKTLSDDLTRAEHMLWSTPDIYDHLGKDKLAEDQWNESFANALKVRDNLALGSVQQLCDIRKNIVTA